MNNVEYVDLHKATIKEVCAEGWSLSYPEWVRETFVRALKTPVLPVYAVAQVEKAIKVAVAINERLNKDEAAVTNAGKRNSSAAKAAARKADKRARDREIRMRMKSPKGSKS